MNKVPRMYEVEHQLIYPDADLIAYLNRVMVNSDSLLTNLRNSHIESCPKCQKRLTELRQTG
jgi:hypothetical protein